MDTHLFSRDALLFDITLPLLPGMTVWPGDPEVSVESAASISGGDGCNVAGFRFGSHTGTHLDAPRHFFDEGMPLEALSLSRLNGPCFVADLTEVTHSITSKDLQNAGIPPEVTRLLLKTRNSELWNDLHHPFQPDFVDLDLEAADNLLEMGIQLIGIDYLSIENALHPDYPVHRKLLSQTVLLLEGLDLREVPPGLYDLYCLPLLTCNGDGAPARVLLMR